MTASTLDAAPRASARGAVSNAEPHQPPLSFTVLGQALARAGRDDYPAWLNHVQAAAGCTRPIRLTGDLYTVRRDGDRAIVLDTTSTDAMPDEVIYKACGNRRHTVCPSCAGTYQRDAYQLVRAGLVGGKGIPESVARHGAVFATFTAPSFGTVHTRTVSRHTCTNRRRCDCRPDPCHPRRDAGLCHHGKPAVCWARHDPGDTVLGQPLCLDCYDHDHQVVWNLATGELWRRTKQTIERHLAGLCRDRGIPFHPVPTPDGKIRYLPPVRVSHGKAAEYQARGAVHFHALLRLDGVDPTDPDAIVPPPAGIDVDDLEDAVRHAAAVTTWTTPEHPDRSAGWDIAWGDQLDIQHVALTGRGSVTDSMVAGYLAKYAAKSTEATGHTSTRITGETIDTYADAEGDHTARLIDACWRLGRPTTPSALRNRPPPRRPARRLKDPWTCRTCRTRTRLAVCPRCTDQRQAVLDSASAKPAARGFYQGLRRWAHMLGFGGHFLTKARRYSVTFQLLRGTRVTFRRATEREADQPIRAADHTEEETTLIVGVLSYAGTGWHTTGDALLANTAADLARSRHAAGREELAHETGTALNVAAPAAA